MSPDSLPALFDAHVHFWDPQQLQYAWLSDAPSLSRAFLPEEFDGFASASVGGALFVEANCNPSQSRDEVLFVERLRRNEQRIAGIVAFVNLLDEGARDATLDQLQTSGCLVGVRQNIQGHAASFALAPAFMRGVASLAARGLTFDLCATADQLDAVVQLAGQVGGTRLVLDHCGKPAIRTDSFSSWASAMERLAAHDNVVCKLSGLLTEARADQRTSVALRPYVEHVRSCFGATRLMYGSDWPVVTLAGGEPVWRALVAELTDDWSHEEQSALRYETAQRTYGLSMQHAH